MGTDDGIVWYLRASERDFGAVRLITLEGRISSATAAQLSGWLHQGGAPPRRAVIVDLSAVDYVNGTGLREFERAADHLASSGAEFVICGLQPVIRTAFELAGPIRNLTIEPSFQAAVQRFADDGERLPGRS